MLLTHLSVVIAMRMVTDNVTPVCVGQGSASKLTAWRSRVVVLVKTIDLELLGRNINTVAAKRSVAMKCCRFEVDPGSEVVFWFHVAYVHDHSSLPCQLRRY